jgi:hypothetical protein
MNLKILSLGAGVQSTTLALMAVRGEIEKPDYAIFADTGWEPQNVYQHLDWLEGQLNYPLIRAKRHGLSLGDLAIEIAHKPVTRTAMPPWFVTDQAGNKTMLPKQCAKEFKARVVQREIRKLLGVAAKARTPANTKVEQWLGISTDEAHRMKPAESKWIENRWPLIEMGVSRQGCLSWLEKNGYPAAPKSSCIFCPYKGDKQWREMKDKMPQDWEAVVAFDKAIRPGFHGMEGQAFVHRSAMPLDRVDLRSWEEKGQPDLFGEECEGMCGV